MTSSSIVRGGDCSCLLAIPNWSCSLIVETLVAHSSVAWPSPHSFTRSQVYSSVNFIHNSTLRNPSLHVLGSSLLAFWNGLPFSMHSAQTACLLNLVSLWTSATGGCQNQGCDWNYLRLLPSFPAIFQHLRPLNSTINAPPA